MPKLACSFCNQHIEADNSLIGQDIACPNCGKLVPVKREATPQQRELLKQYSGESPPTTTQANGPHWLLSALSLAVVIGVAAQSVRLEMKVGEVESGVSDLKETLGVGSRSSGLGSIEFDISSMESDISGVQSDLIGIESDVSTLTSALAELKDAIGVGSYNGYSSMSSLKNDVDQIQTDVSSIESDMSSMESDISSIKRDMMFSR